MQAGLAGLGALTTAATRLDAGVSALAGAAGPEFSFHHDHVLGTSLDVWVAAPAEAAAEAAESVILDEIERLRRVFSTYDPTSELSVLNRSSGSLAASPDLRAVLREYEAWQRRSAGACNAQVGALVRLWAEAEQADTLPNARMLAEVARRIAEPGWVVDDVGGTVTRLSDQPLNLNSVAKGYVIRRAVAAARSSVPAVRGLLVNLGGDLCAWSRPEERPAVWLIGVQDPFRSEENAPPLTAIRLRDAAVATSGGYQRSYRVAGGRYSHLLDPRTGQPADAVASATVVAADSVTANVLATTLCILGPEGGLRLVAATPGAECLIVAASGERLRSTGFAVLEVPGFDDSGAKKDGGDKPEKAKDEAWPADHQVTIALELPTPPGRARRPYVAIWVEDANGKAVRTIAVWGNSPRWITELSGWWKLARDDKDLVKAVTRATRAPGKYDVVWDGKDDKGNPLPQGTYSIRVEVHREHGKHVTQTGKIACGTEAAKVTLDKNAETGETVVEYGKKK
jgi:thiamine biosynthesis lipoprotein ApbE